MSTQEAMNQAAHYLSRVTRIRKWEADGNEMLVRLVSPYVTPAIDQSQEIEQLREALQIVMNRFGDTSITEWQYARNVLAKAVGEPYPEGAA